MTAVKVSVTLSDDDVAFIEDYQRRHGYASRSAVLHKAVSLLRTTGLTPAYEAAWGQLDAGDDD